MFLASLTGKALGVAFTIGSLVTTSPNMALSLGISTLSVGFGLLFGIKTGLVCHVINNYRAAHADSDHPVQLDDRAGSSVFRHSINSDSHGHVRQRLSGSMNLKAAHSDHIEQSSVNHPMPCAGVKQTKSFKNIFLNFFSCHHVNDDKISGEKNYNNTSACP